MATSLISPLTAPTTGNRESLTTAIGIPKASFLHGTKLSLAPNTRATTGRRWRFVSPMASKNPLDRIPKQFRPENLPDGLMDNYKNVPQHLYGLNPSQIDMLMAENNTVARVSEDVTEESISACSSYLNNGLSGMTNRGPSKYSMSATMYRGGGRGYGRPRSPAPPDLPSILLDARIVYLGMPIVPQVVELLAAQFLWLHYDSATKPIYLYINSSGSENDELETIGSEYDAYVIAGAMAFCSAKIYTVNLSMAYGQAAMLFALGAKGHRGLLPSASTKLYLPKVYRSGGNSTDMWIKAKELDSTTNTFLKLLSTGIGKSKEELLADLRSPKYFDGVAAIDYGIADKVMLSLDNAVDRTNYLNVLAESEAKKKAQLAQPRPRDTRVPRPVFQ